MILVRGASVVGQERKFDAPSKQPLERLLRSVTCLTVYASNSAFAVVDAKEIEWPLSAARSSRLIHFKLLQSPISASSEIGLA